MIRVSDRLRTTLVFTGLAALLLTALVAAALYSFREFSLRGAEERARTAAEIVRVSLTEAMANGAIDKRAQLLSRIGRGAGLTEVRVVRGSGVVRQFGRGLNSERGVDDIDSAVLAGGKAEYIMVEGSDGPMLRATIPYIAERGAQPDCLQCHQAAAGEVLGAITIGVSLAETRIRALIWVSVLVGIAGFFAIAALYLMRRQYQPMAEVALNVEEAVARAASGDFGMRLPAVRDGVAGHISAGVNRLMEALDNSVGTINGKVEQLMEYDLPRSRNMLLSTLEMVEGLVDAGRFKQSIEEDESKQEIYDRLSRIIRERFDLDSFSIYEVANSKNHIRAAVVNGLPDAEIRWCDQEILVRADACRARRTGHMVNAIDEPGICGMFRPNPGEQGMAHVCLPMMQSGNVGCIVQLVTMPETAPLVRALVPFLRVYLRETAPVLEAKRLMESLRESSLQDAMTGLYNRRFIEAYVETLKAAVQRKGSHLAVLMLDVDHFKKVNDTYGHDAGDKVLVAVAGALKQTLRKSDILVRFGGEEFLAFLQDTAGEGGMVAAEKVRAAVEALKIALPNGTLQKTISIGVADFPEDSADFWEAVKFADAALYAAKERGRNRVVRFTPDLWKSGN
ncbi:MAG: diguanylate cyclase [Candidatus Nitricoxidivorans perseverans]|uniref:diguanylate cyclase n=1 Tax=Candidatus Nitricoxidivorans perseverans TaxID=2975601 RepID=A0AA49FL34_9PROT|nr:MAG: diguanylate cyclase [Candidatus Nitricoxidivorans perseverans]